MKSKSKGGYKKQLEILLVLSIFMSVAIIGLYSYSKVSLTNVNSIWELDTQCYGMSVTSNVYPFRNIWTLNNPPYVLDADTGNKIDNNWISHERAIGNGVDGLTGESIATVWTMQKMSYKPLKAFFATPLFQQTYHYASNIPQGDWLFNNGLESQGTPEIVYEIYPLTPSDNAGNEKPLEFYYPQPDEIYFIDETLENGTIVSHKYTYTWQLRYFYTTITLKTISSYWGETGLGLESKYVENALTNVNAYMELFAQTKYSDVKLKAEVANVFVLSTNNGFSPSSERELYADQSWAGGINGRVYTQEGKLPIYIDESNGQRDIKQVFSVSATLQSALKYQYTSGIFGIKYVSTRQVLEPYTNIKVLIEMKMNRLARIDTTLIEPDIPDVIVNDVTPFFDWMMTNWLLLILGLGFILAFSFIYFRGKRGQQRELQPKTEVHIEKGGRFYTGIPERKKTRETKRDEKTGKFTEGSVEVREKKKHWWSR